MDSNSFRTFGNTPTDIIRAETKELSAHDLALHAMRDRCVLLQRRIQTLEKENMNLKLDNNKYLESKNDLSKNIPSSVVRHLETIAELTKQKSQLMNHIEMVTEENRNLWNKISTMKEIKVENDSSQINVHQNRLVRSNTYITDRKEAVERLPEPSLEEISLKLIDGYIKEKSQLVEQYEEFSQLQKTTSKGLDSVRFSYLDEDNSLNKSKLESIPLEALKKEIKQQESDLKNVLKLLQRIKDKKPSHEAHRNLVSSCVQTSFEQTNLQQTSPNNSEVILENHCVEESSVQSKANVDKFHICPMCGEEFNLNKFTFSEFQRHVEEHFVSENSEQNNS